MMTNKEVFAKRKEGAIDEAYQMALQLMRAPDIDEWDFKALAWCLIDLIKRDANAGQIQNLAHYRQQLEIIKVNPNDDILQKGVGYALSLCNPHGQLIGKAKSLSKQGNHVEAANIYRKLYANGAADIAIQTSLAWELYKQSKKLMAQKNVNLSIVKKHLNDYLKLEVEKPSLLHTCFLQLASKLAGEDNFNMLVFVRLWGLEYLRQEDFDRYVANNGKEYPSIAERAIQQASKQAAGSERNENLNYILPYIDQAITRFPDNIWLKYNKAKILLVLERYNDALTYGLEVTKAKVNDYWAWELLGDIYSPSDSNATLSSYCKALLCSSDDKFTGKVRLKLAQRLVEMGDFASAKYEVERLVAYRNKEGQKIPEDATRIITEAWYGETKPRNSNVAFYKSNAPAAESLLFSEMPWLNTNVGEKFTVPGKEDKPKRRLFVNTLSEPIEVNIPEFKFKFSNLNPGDALRIKGDFDTNNRFQVYVIEKRDSDNQWDVFSEKIGIVDHVNKDRKLIHFLVDRDLDGLVPFSKLDGSFQEGDAIAVKLSRYTSKQGQQCRVLQAGVTDQIPSTSVKKQFCEEVRESNGMGFTPRDIFIPPPLMNEHQIKNGQIVSGDAVLNYNKKRESWSWKAVSIDRETRGLQA
ncbi:MAG: hypothetical protein RBR67_16220 [Desulfobacterium sp.]|jgi:hypothetical protein|nr:hypothetical protein [Desulfobacterium sp.]